MGKRVICACEDVTEQDFEASLARGYRDVESVKRYTGFGTGFCQGKSCLAPASDWLVAHGLSPSQAVAFTPRPPALPTELRCFAALEPDAIGPPGPGVPPLEELANVSTLRPDGPLPERCRVAIVGGGIMGLALAYNL